MTTDRITTLTLALKKFARGRASQDQVFEAAGVKRGLDSAYGRGIGGLEIGGVFFGLQSRVVALEKWGDREQDPADAPGYYVHHWIGGVVAGRQVSDEGEVAAAMIAGIDAK